MFEVPRPPDPRFGGSGANNQKQISPDSRWWLSLMAASPTIPGFHCGVSRLQSFRRVAVAPGFESLCPEPSGSYPQLNPFESEQVQAPSLGLPQNQKSKNQVEVQTVSVKDRQLSKLRAVGFQGDSGSGFWES